MITTSDISKIRQKFKIGQVIIINTYKAKDGDSVSHKPVVRRAEIIAGYPYFAVVRLPSGVCDSVLWIDLKNKAGR